MREGWDEGAGMRGRKESAREEATEQEKDGARERGCKGEKERGREERDREGRGSWMERGKDGGSTCFMGMRPRTCRICCLLSTLRARDRKAVR